MFEVRGIEWEAGQLAYGCSARKAEKSTIEYNSSVQWLSKIGTWRIDEMLSEDTQNSNEHRCYEYTVDRGE